MSEIQLECQGLPCPQPVLKCKYLIENQTPASIAVSVDNEAAKENVSRFLNTQGYETTIENNGSEFVISGIKSIANNAECKISTELNNEIIADLENQKILVFIASDVIGSGDDELGRKLMYSFLLTLREMGNDLWRIVILNGGVKLAVPENPCMKELQHLEKQGISVLVCGTCLEHFGLTGRQKIGEVTNMLDVVTSFQLATKTIRV
ncbi:MAG: sulfurtransferase-like selenium metabolism protein YedF [Pseudodesulfovibrio sp.]|nr:sulfurtransferase-like selenium metabolism protein YedF [Pseudodesulfovibrio sp.]